MKISRRPVLAILFASAFVFSQCKRADDVEEHDENELITTVKLNFTEAGTTTKQTFQWVDKDGDGGNAPTVFDNILLKANTHYNVTVEFWDESKTPAEDITEEIEEHADEHLVVFTSSPTSLLTYAYSDQDSNGLPIGLSGSVHTGTANSGKLNLRLRHQPPVNGTPSKNGTVAPGSDDVNLDFNLTIN